MLYHANISDQHWTLGSPLEKKDDVFFHYISQFIRVIRKEITCLLIDLVIEKHQLRVYEPIKDKRLRSPRIQSSGETDICVGYEFGQFRETRKRKKK